MNDLILTIKSIIIAQVRMMPVRLITNDLLCTLVDNQKVVYEGNRELTTEERNGVLNELKNHYIADLNYDQDLVELERGQVLSDPDPKLHEVWQFDTQHRFFWRKQREFLITTLTKRMGAQEASKIINSIDFETDSILSSMEDPARREFDSRGLVVGYVQSGKTANFTALLSKAADAGYRFFIVLAGIHDELRQQTQIRIDRELGGYNNLGLPGDFVEWNDFESSRRWNNLTSAGWLLEKETGEFSGKGINRFFDVFSHKDRPVIAVIKKNVRIMDRLIKWIENSEDSHRINVPVLIIDDEADQASVDGNATKPDSDPAKTNERIRKILNLFKRSSYIGYTATPFANVFIKHDAEHDKLGEDLYPRNFIYALPEPSGYFGTRRIFGENLDKYLVKEVASPKADKKDLGDHGIITDDLSEAIFAFYVGMAIRYLRGHDNMPMSMMIHVDQRVSKMDRVGDVVTEYLKTISRNIPLEDITIFVRKFLADSAILNDTIGSGNDQFDNTSVVNETVRLFGSDKVHIRILNSGTDDKLDYAKEPNMKVIAIGGNKLSRGLTLEGLMTTYYLRAAKQFDTLLQMGRWFGYRKGYEDLVRIYTSKEIWTQFQNLAVVELEFRNDIEAMVKLKKTPKEFAIGVKQIMGLLPTSKNKLGAAELQKNHGGSQVSVTRLSLEYPDQIDSNILATKSLIASIIDRSIDFIAANTAPFPTRLAKNVPKELVLPFLKQFRLAVDVDGNTFDFEPRDILRYLTDQNYEYWNVVIPSLGSSSHSNVISLHNHIQVIPVNRARMKTTPVNGVYNIKAISSRSDRLVDLDPRAENEYDGRITPLLMLYVIDRSSSPQNATKKQTRLPLYQDIDSSMHRDPIAYSIIFPPTSNVGGRYIQPLEL